MIIRSFPLASGSRRHGMRIRFLRSIGATAAIVSVLLCLNLTSVTAADQAPAASANALAAATVLKTPWDEPDLQGIWTDESDTPFQRSPKYANQEFLTEAQRAEFDKVRSGLRGRDMRGERGSERDVSGAYNAVWGGLKRTGAHTSLIVDPPDGRIPPPTQEALKITAAD